MIWRAPTGLPGPVPEALSTLPKLVSLNIPLCGLSGPLPSGLANIQTLEHLDLSYNTFEGPIPADYGNLESIISMGPPVCQPQWPHTPGIGQPAKPPGP